MAQTPRPQQQLCSKTVGRQPRTSGRTSTAPRLNSESCRKVWWTAWSSGVAQGHATHLLITKRITREASADLYRRGCIWTSEFSFSTEKLPCWVQWNGQIWNIREGLCLACHFQGQNEKIWRKCKKKIWKQEYLSEIRYLVGEKKQPTDIVSFLGVVLLSIFAEKLVME